LETAVIHCLQWSSNMLYSLLGLQSAHIISSSDEQRNQWTTFFARDPMAMDDLMSKPSGKSGLSGTCEVY